MKTYVLTERGMSGTVTMGGVDIKLINAETFNEAIAIVMSKLQGISTITFDTKEDQFSYYITHDDYGVSIIGTMKNEEAQYLTRRTINE